MSLTHIKTQLKGQLELREKVLVDCHCACRRENEIREWLWGL